MAHPPHIGHVPIIERLVEGFCFGDGGPYRWYVAAVGVYFYCQLVVNVVVVVLYVDVRCKHHNILVVNRVDYTGLDFCALAGVEADASCGYGTATSPACDAGAAKLRPLWRWGKRLNPIQGATASLGDSGWRQFFPWWITERCWDSSCGTREPTIMRENPGSAEDGRCSWTDEAAGQTHDDPSDCDPWWTPGYPEATYAACAVVNGVDRRQLFSDDGTARWAVVHRWGFLAALSAGIAGGTGGRWCLSTTCRVICTGFSPRHGTPRSYARSVMV